MELHVKDFNYELPEDRIALFPTEKREQSKLLVYNGNTIQHKSFRDIVDVLPDDSLLVFNNSKVIPARLFFEKDTGAIIEIFVLGPTDKPLDYRSFFSHKSPVSCLCTIGNKKKWPKNKTLTSTINKKLLAATLLNEEQAIVEFSWDGTESWGEIIQEFGNVPLPPYIKRAPVEHDKERYQTVYSTIPGAVAAPTAGLHFTDKILNQLRQKGVKTEYLTLHVGAGTFLPIKSKKVVDHQMHAEKLVFSIKNIDALLKHSGRVIPIGTTSCRSLESLYWFGVKLLAGQDRRFNIDQDFPYQHNKNLPSRLEAIAQVKTLMSQTGATEIEGTTSIFIYPSYSFKMCDGLVTNFHQPGSTLILLVAALIDEDWRSVYQAALQNGYRFLSYGDCSLLIKS